MTNPCCSNQEFERDPDSSVADIGEAGGIDFTVGRCRSCGHLLMDAWASYGGSTQTISKEFLDQLLKADLMDRKKILKRWFDS